MSKKKKFEAKKAAIQKQQEEVSALPKLKMVFSEDQYYVTAGNKEYDLANPKYQKGVAYEIEAKEKDRWLKRGGVIVEEPVKEPVKSPEPVEEEPEEVKEPVEAEDEKVEDLDLE